LLLLVPQRQPANHDRGPRKKKEPCASYCRSYHILLGFNGPERVLWATPLPRTKPATPNMYVHIPTWHKYELILTIEVLLTTFPSVLAVLLLQHRLAGPLQIITSCVDQPCRKSGLMSPASRLGAEHKHTDQSRTREMRRLASLPGEGGADGGGRRRRQTETRDQNDSGLRAPSLLVTLTIALLACSGRGNAATGALECVAFDGNL
jgi:hypothetical protein